MHFADRDEPSAGFANSFSTPSSHNVFIEAKPAFSFSAPDDVFHKRNFSFAILVSVACYAVSRIMLVPAIARLPRARLGRECVCARARGTEQCQVLYISDKSSIAYTYAAIVQLSSTLLNHFTCLHATWWISFRLCGCMTDGSALAYDEITNALEKRLKVRKQNDKYV